MANDAKRLGLIVPSVDVGIETGPRRCGLAGGGPLFDAPLREVA